MLYRYSKWSTDPDAYRDSEVSIEALLSLPSYELQLWHQHDQTIVHKGSHHLQAQRHSRDTDSQDAKASVRNIHSTHTFIHTSCWSASVMKDCDSPVGACYTQTGLCAARTQETGVTFTHPHNDKHQGD